MGYIAGYSSWIPKLGWSAPTDMRPTCGMKLVAAAAGLFEIGAPLLLLWPLKTTMVYLGAASLIAMHATIMLVAFFWVGTWNWFYIAATVLLLANPAHVGIDVVGVYQMSWFQIACIALDALFIIVAHAFPNVMSLGMGHRIFTCNWPNATVLIKRTAMQKLSKLGMESPP